LYSSNIREKIVQILELSSKLLLFHFGITSISRKIYENFAGREVKRMATKGRNRVAIIYLTTV
jgi:hypothetical protein